MRERFFRCLNEEQHENDGFEAKFEMLDSGDQEQDVPALTYASMPLMRGRGRLFENFKKKFQIIRAGDFA